MEDILASIKRVIAEEKEIRAAAPPSEVEGEADEEDVLVALARAGFRAEHVTKSTTTVGLPASVQYAIFGRCLFPHGLPFRLAATACVVVFPLAWLVDRVQNDGDVLHVIARSLE